MSVRTQIAILCLLALAGTWSVACEDDPPSPARAAAGPVAHRLGTPSDAWPLLLASKPRVLAVGEYHQTEATAGVQSAVSRFTAGMIDGLKGRASDLVLETWVASGQCGQVEQRATAAIGQTTQRPETTEDELITLLKAAKAIGIAPHILSLSCEDYTALGQGEDLDYGKLLVLTRDKLLRESQAVLQARQGSEGLLVIYGGAIHNDIDPAPEDRKYAFGPALAAAVQQGFVELDLVVPAFVDLDLIRELDWFPLYSEAVARGELVLLERNPRSFVLVFPK